MSEHVPTEDYYCAQRDSDGNVRLNCGRGALIAGPEDTIDVVRKWFEDSLPGRFREQYRSALRLLLDEAYIAAGIPFPATVPVSTGRTEDGKES